MIAYADDVSAVIVADSEDIIMEEFFEYCGLSMNPNKSDLIVFGRGQKGQELPNSLQ